MLAFSAHINTLFIMSEKTTDLIVKGILTTVTTYCSCFYGSQERPCSLLDFFFHSVILRSQNNHVIMDEEARFPVMMGF